MPDLQRGTQIIYIPPHVREQLPTELTEDTLWLALRRFSEVEAGFVTSTKTQSDGQQVAFCRYWSRIGSHRGGIPADELRTKANSEATPVESLYPLHVKAQQVVDRALEHWC